MCLRGAWFAYLSVLFFCPGRTKIKPVPSTTSLLSQKEEVTKDPPCTMIAPNLGQV